MAQKRDVLSKRIVTKELGLALDKAAALMKHKKKQVMTAEMLLLACVLTPEVEAHQLLQDFSRERGFDWAQFERSVDLAAGDRLPARDAEFDIMTGQGQRVALNNEVLIILDEGLNVAESLDQKQCGSGQALAIMAHIQAGTHWLLNRHGVTQQAVLNALKRGSATIDYVTSAQGRVESHIYHRRDLDNKLLNLLSMTSQRNIVLIGSAGVGKRSLVLSLAQLIAQGKGPVGLKRVVELEERALLDDSLKAVETAIRQAQGGVLFVPDIDRFFGGIRAEVREEAGGNALQKALFSDDVVVIGTATEENYNKKLNGVRAIVEQSQIVRIPPASIDETAEILKVLRPKFEADYDLIIIEESLNETARLAGRYYTVEPLPGAAVHLLHRSCAMFRVELDTTPGQQLTQDGQLDVEDVLKATSLVTGIPMTNLGADERERYMNMEEHLHKRIIGQNEAVQALSRAVKMARVGLKDPKRPIGSFLFLGPTGVGKSELAKVLAEFMFGTEDALITLDMSEYMESSSVNRLIGSPPGYIGHDAGGQLTDTVKKQPYSVVLFDEVEKANVKVFDVLLQVLDEGRLTSGQGETVTFSECVILMTSNIGGRYLANPNIPVEDGQAAAEEAVKEHFRPEFLNRLDNIIYFHLLSDHNLSDILDLLLRREEKLLAGRDLSLQLSDAAKRWVLAQNEHPEWGARPLRRLLQKHIREPLADFLLKEEPLPNTIIKVQKQGKGLRFVQR